MNYQDRIKLSNKVHPFFQGISSDLLFWPAINTLFLVTVKGFSAAQISSLTTIGTLSSIVFYHFIFKIIKKIGDLNSIKLGVILLLCSALLLTFSNTYLLILLGAILYNISSLFKNMDNVLLRKNLTLENRVEDYFYIQNKTSLIYAFVTMVIAFTTGFLFNVNNYLPMILCIFFCLVNVILSNFLYETKTTETKSSYKKQKFNISKNQIVFLSLLLFGSLYSVIDLGQSNSKLFIQYELSSFLEIDKVAIILTFIIAISRIVRVVTDFLFTSVYK